MVIQIARRLGCRLAVGSNTILGPLQMSQGIVLLSRLTFHCPLSHLKRLSSSALYMISALGMALVSNFGDFCLVFRKVDCYFRGLCLVVCFGDNRVSRHSVASNL